MTQTKSRKRKHKRNLQHHLPKRWRSVAKLWRANKQLKKVSIFLKSGKTRIIANRGRKFAEHATQRPWWPVDLQCFFLIKRTSNVVLYRLTESKSWILGKFKRLESETTLKFYGGGAAKFHWFGVASRLSRRSPISDAVFGTML